MWLSEESSLSGHFIDAYKVTARSDYYLDQWPTITNRGDQHKAIHATRHVNVREKDLDFRMMKKKLDRLSGTSCLKDVKAAIFELAYHFHADKRFVFYDK